MKSSELRIGNWVNDRGSQPFQILPNHILGLYQCEIAERINIDINPIRLTKEWILKFGGKRCSFNPKKLTCSYKIDGIKGLDALYIHNYWGGYELDQGYELHKLHPPGEDWFNLRYHNGYCELKYVHQLQNLYFVLTGEELTISAPPSHTTPTP